MSKTLTLEQRACHYSLGLPNRRTKYPLVPKVRCTVSVPNESNHKGNAKGKSKNRQRKNTDGPPRLVQMLGAISDRRGAQARIARRYARHFLWRRVRVMLASVVAMRNMGRRKIVIVVVVVLVVVRIEGAIVGTAIVATRWRVLGLLGIVRVVL
jgi:hypothetical protein